MTATDPLPNAPTPVQSGRVKANWVAATVAAVILIGVVGLIAIVVVEIGDTEMSSGGWIAMVLGALATLALGIGLMSLVFISNRRGYDDQAGDDAVRRSD